MSKIALDKIAQMTPQGTTVDTEQVKLVGALNQLLAEEYSLFTKTLKYHWSVTGPRFQSVHAFLEKHYKELLEVMDDVAERVRIIGMHPISTIAEMKECSDLSESPNTLPDTNNMLANLFSDHVKIQGLIRTTLEENENAIKFDKGTEDFLISVLQKHEFMSWTLKSHLSQ